jgi:hypothetical protein
LRKTLETIKIEPAQVIVQVKNQTCTGNCARAERDEAASAIASARSATLAADDDEDDLDSVDTDEDAEYEAFLEELYSPSE